MKLPCLLAVVLLFLSGNSIAQIQYTRQTVKQPDAAVMQLVANVGGAHHLIYFNANKAPLIYVYDSKLQTCTIKEIDIKPHVSHDINILQFNDYYLLYLHSVKTNYHHLFLVKPDGSSKNISSVLARKADSTWNRSKATFQLFNQNEQLLILSHTYYDAIKKVGTTLVKFNQDLAVESVNRVLFSFDDSRESLGQVVISGNELVVMKTGKNPDNGGEIVISRIQIANGYAVSRTFDAGQHLYVNPTFQFNTDSSILVSSLLGDMSTYSRSQRGIFICNLGDSLQELAPVTLLKNQFRKNAADNFLLFGERYQTWLHMGLITARPLSRSGSSRSGQASSYSEDYPVQTETGFSIQNNVNTPTHSYTSYSNPTAIRFSLVNDKFKIVRDSLVANDGNVYDVLPRPFGKFIMKGKAYLVLVQNFSGKKRGLLLVSSGTRGEFSTEDVPVYDRYQYLLSQLQAVGDKYFIVPYTYKNEIGLVKVTMDD